MIKDVKEKRENIRLLFIFKIKQFKVFQYKR